jgi:hypothetical protein
MAHNNVGMVCGAATGQVYAIINPDDDSELYNPRWLLLKIAIENREALTMVQIPLTDYMACTHPDQVQILAKNRLGIKE